MTAAERFGVALVLALALAAATLRTLWTALDPRAPITAYFCLANGSSYVPTDEERLSRELGIPRDQAGVVIGSAHGWLWESPYTGLEPWGTPWVDDPATQWTSHSMGPDRVDDASRR